MEDDVRRGIMLLSGFMRGQAEVDGLGMSEFMCQEFRERGSCLPNQSFPESYTPFQVHISQNIQRTFSVISIVPESRKGSKRVNIIPPSKK